MLNELFTKTVTALEWWFSFCRMGYGYSEPEEQPERRYIEYHEQPEYYHESYESESDDEGINVWGLIIRLILLSLIIAFAIVDVWAVCVLVKNLIRVFIWGCEFAW